MAANDVVPENIRINIEDLIDGIEDVTDPSSMDNILDYVERVQEEDEQFMALLVKRVKHAYIDWNIPWYQERGSLIRQKPFEEADEEKSYRKDTISQEEHELIEKNWNSFRKRYKLPDQIISLARWRNYNRSKNPAHSAEEKSRRFAAAYLSRGLQRTIAQVFKHLMAYYCGYRKGYYNKTEEKVIEICFHHQPKLVGNILSVALGREPRGLYKRLGHLRNGKPEKKRQKWTLPVVSKLVQNMLKYTELELIDLKNTQIETWVWHRLEEDLERSSGNIQHFWYCYLHVQLFVRSDLKLKKFRKKCFKKLRDKAYDSTYKVWTDIRWKDVASEMPDGVTARFMYRICNVIAKTLEGYLRKPLEDVADYALRKLNEPSRLRNKRLKLLKLNEDGQLEYVDYIDHK